jgi:hypothetical protein
MIMFLSIINNKTLVKINTIIIYYKSKSPESLLKNFNIAYNLFITSRYLWVISFFIYGSV